MQQALKDFKIAIARVRALHSVCQAMQLRVTPAIDLSDIQRSCIVLAVSTFDFFVHEFVRLGMLECFSGARAPSKAYLTFQVPVSALSGLSIQTFDSEVRRRHSYLSFQSPEKVADATRLFSDVALWKEVATRRNVTAEDAKKSISLIVDRRNKIAHEADRDPTFPEQLWPISDDQVLHVIDEIEATAEAIYAVCV